MLNITKGKINRAQRVCLYGCEGIGKTTFASKFPNPLFIDTEGGSAHLDVRRVAIGDSWEELIRTIYEVAANPDVCSTLVIDTADWAEQLCIRDICKRYKVDGLEGLSYGKGYTYVGEEFTKLLRACDAVIDSGNHVVITAHAKMREFEQPDEMGSYDRWEMKLTRQTAPLVKEWCDLLLFCNYKTFVVTQDNDKAKAQGGKRVMYTTHHPCWDAKNRQDLPEMLDLDYAKIAHIFETNPEAKKSVKEELAERILKAGITTEALQEIVVAKGHYPQETPVTEYDDGFIKRWVFPNWNKILEIIKNKKES